MLNADQPTPRPRGLGTPLLRLAGFACRPKCTHGSKILVRNEHGQILMVRQRFRERGAWDLPGGFIGRHESPIDAAARELKEETGVDAPLQKLELIAEYKQPWARHYEHLFLHRMTSTELNGNVRSWEIRRASWHDADALPQLASAAHEALVRASISKKF